MRDGAVREFDIVVVRALRGLGDALCAVPALRALRHSFPDAYLRYVGIDAVEPVLARFPGYVDEFVAFPGWPGIPERSERVDVAAAERCRAADLVVQMHGDGCVSNSYCVSLEPRSIAAHGTVVAPEGCRVTTREFHIADNEIVRCLDVVKRAARLLGRDTMVGSSKLEFPLRSADVAEADACRSAFGIGSAPYAVLHTGAATEERRWPEERFAAVGRLLGEHGVVPVLTGTESERPAAEKTAELIGPGARVVAGHLSLGGVAALLAGARGVITNDTGISHLTAALEVPSVVVFTGSDPQRWAPLDASLHRAVSRVGGRRTAGAGRFAPSVADTLAAVAAAGISH